jgi:CRISPR/Cas system-associated exonuclease Cas4 (RecB family)
MRIIRASEIGTYLYCQRAWWYRLQGVAPEHQEVINAGIKYHRSHSRQVFASKLLRFLAFAMLTVAIVLAAVYLVN